MAPPSLWKTLLMTSVVASLSAVTSSDAADRVLSRRRRYLVFPEGTSLQLVYCLTVPTLIPDTIFNYGWSAGLAWQLPSDARSLFGKRRKGEGKHDMEGMMHRRHRRDVYGKLETFLNTVGMNGRACVLRALCETGQRAFTKGAFMDELLHAIFSLPAAPDDYGDGLQHYDQAHSSTLDCAQLFPDCPTSILELGLHEPDV